MFLTTTIYVPTQHYIYFTRVVFYAFTFDEVLQTKLPPPHPHPKSQDKSVLHLLIYNIIRYWRPAHPLSTYILDVSWSPPGPGTIPGTTLPIIFWRPERLGRRQNKFSEEKLAAAAAGAHTYQQDKPIFVL